MHYKYLHGCGLVALSYEMKTYENLFCGLFGQIYENLHSKNLQLYGMYTYTHLDVS